MLEYLCIPIGTDYTLAYKISETFRSFRTPFECPQ